MKRHQAFVASLALAALTTPAFADVIVVNAAGGGDFTTIQPAINAAVDGDTILVKPGNYFSDITVDGKALTIVGDEGALPNVPAIWVKNIAAGSTLTLARLKGGYGPSGALRIENCQGAVRVVACELTGSDGLQPGTQHGKNAVSLAQASNVAFSSCVLFGGKGWWDARNCIGQYGFGGVGLYSASSTSASYDCDIRGGRGGTGAKQAGPGGNGITVLDEAETGSLLFASRSYLQGGNAGPTNCLDVDPFPGPPGYGLAMGEKLEPLSVQLLDDSVVGGGALPGPPIQGGPPFLYAASSLQLSLPAVARELTYLTLTFTGDPGDHVYLNDALTTTFALVPSWRGVVLSPFPDTSGGPVRARRWGVIPASGVLTQVYRAPALPAGVEAQTRFLQAYRIRANGLTLGSFATLTVLDSSF